MVEELSVIYVATAARRTREEEEEEEYLTLTVFFWVIQIYSQLRLMIYTFLT